MKFSLKQKAILALIIANMIWGAASPIFKWSLENIPLFTLAYLRFFGAALLIFPFAFLKNLNIDRRDFFKLLLLAISGITFNITFFFLGLKSAPSINAPIIASSGPILLILSSIFFLKEHPRLKTILGALISLIGVFTIIGRPLFEGLSAKGGPAFGWNLTEVAGNLFFLLATIGAVCHTLLAKDLSHKYPALSITFWSFVLGAVSFFPLFLRDALIYSGLPPLDIRGITGLVFGIILSSTLAYTLYLWAIEKIDASEVGVFTYIDPVIATVIAIPLLGEVITPLFILGSFFVFLGIFVAEGRLHYHPFHKLRSPR